MRNRLLLFSAFLLLASVSATAGQAPQQPVPSPEIVRPTDDDPIQQLNLTPEQRGQIRSIRETSKAERTAANQKLREANRALQEALNNENPDESVVEHRLRDVAAAQASQTRMRVLTEIRIRRVLNPEQRLLLQSLQQEARENRRQRGLQDPEERMKQRAERMRAIQERRNGINPLQRRRELQRRLP